MLITEIKKCRSCGSAKLGTVLHLGNLAISNFINLGDPEEKAPLELVVCRDCSLVQLRHTVDRDYLYDQYWYRSGTNESMVAALQDVVDDAMSRVHLQVDDYVLDIGANDGSLLADYPRYVYCHGFEPAHNLVAEATKRAHARIFPDYFPPKSGWRPKQKYKIVSAIAQFYNIENPNAYIAAINDFLHEDGIWVVQFQDLDSMLLCNGVDNVCHEHTMYLSQDAFSAMVARHGMYVDHVSYNQTNGGSMRCIVKHGKSSKILPEVDIERLQAFGRKAELLKDNTVYLLQRLKAEGKTVLGVAASTKANTLLQYYGIGPDLLPAIADRNPDKFGKVTVGTHIPIISEDELWERKPDYLLALAWHFFAPFRQRYSSLEQGGTKWILPLPNLIVVGGNEPCPQYLADEHSDKGLASTSSVIR